jgi:hypothetical protein
MHRHEHDDRGGVVESILNSLEPVPARSYVARRNPAFDSEPFRRIAHAGSGP